MTKLVQVRDTGGSGTPRTVPRGKRCQCGGKPPTLGTASARVYKLISPATTTAAASAASTAVPQSLRGPQSHPALGSAANAKSSGCVRGTAAGSPPLPPPPARDERVRYALEPPPALPRVSRSCCPAPRALEGVRHRRQRGAPTGASVVARTVETMVDGLKRCNQMQWQATVGRAIQERPWWPARWPGGHLESVGLRLFGWAVGAARATPRRAGEQVRATGA